MREVKCCCGGGQKPDAIADTDGKSIVARENTCDCGCINEEHARVALEKLRELPIFELCDFYKSFADETRLKIICVLDELGEMCVCDIAYALGITKSAISHQLRYLRDKNLLSARKNGKEVYYSLADEHIRDLYEIGLRHIEERL